MSEQRIAIPLPEDAAADLNLAAQLEQHLGADSGKLVRLLADQATHEGQAFYLVGGIVRDLLLGRPSLDIDLVLEGDALPFADALQAQYGGQLERHPRFGTAKWLLPRVELAQQLGVNVEGLPKHLDLITARRESYAQPGDLPQVEFADLEADTQRRDFSINTLAIRLDDEHWGELIDLQGGLEDMRQGLMRVLHDQSFRDDATRLLRLYRFKIRYGFDIEAHTLDLVHAGLDYLKAISGERLRHELDLILQEPDPNAILGELDQAGILLAVHPALAVSTTAIAALKNWQSTQLGSEWELDEQPKSWLPMVLWFMQLDAKDEEVQELGERLALERDLRRAIEQVRAALAEQTEWLDAKASQAAVYLDKLLPLTRAALYLSLEGEAKQRLQAYMSNWQHLHPRANGESLKAMGLKEGPQYARILGSLRAAWVDGEITSADEERALLEHLVVETRDD